MYAKKRLFFSKQSLCGRRDGVTGVHPLRSRGAAAKASKLALRAYRFLLSTITQASLAIVLNKKTGRTAVHPVLKLLRKERDSFSATLRKRLRRWRTMWVLILSSIQKNSAKTRVARLSWVLRKERDSNPRYAKRTTVFETAPIDHSGIFPSQNCAPVVPGLRCKITAFFWTAKIFDKILGKISPLTDS